MQMKFCLVVLAVCCVCLPLRAGAMKKYNGKYHIIYSDLSQDDVCEAIFRVNAMAEQYHSRTKGFAGKITQKLPLYLYGSYSEYQSAVGTQFAQSAGVYTGKELRAVADTAKFSQDDVWHTVQHEGFHQFVHMVIMNGKQNNMPIWLNEGMAEYFGEAKWTGDKLVPGIVDTGVRFKKGNKIYMRQGRMARVQEAIKDDKFKPFARMITLSHEAWNSNLEVINYDHVWSMVHFFVHAQDSKGNYIYRKKFQRYLEAVVKGADNAKSFAKYLGSPSKLEKEYNDWWLSWKKNPSQDVCDRVLIETLVNFMARAEIACKMKFDKADDFFKAAKAGDIKIDSNRFRALWLPQGLLDEAIKQVEQSQDCTWELRKEKNRPMLVMIHKDGSEVRCTYKTQGNAQPILKTTFVAGNDVPDDKGKTKDADEGD